MNWNEIRVMNGSQNEGFEELVCQLANKEPIEGRKAYYRNGKPDGGVECYCVLEEEKEIAWQAKYFTASLTPTQWRELDSSVRRALETHPNMRRYVIAMPVDPPYARIAGQTSMREKWDEHVTKWKEWAAEKEMTVEVDAWWATDIIERLARPENKGLNYFFFHEQEFTDEWMQRRNEKSIADLGVRYTPKLNVELDVAKIFDGLLRNERFYDVWYKVVDELLIAGEKVLRYCKDLNEHQEKIEANIKKIVDGGVCKVYGVRCKEQIPVEFCNSMIDDYSECCEKTLEYYLKEEAKEQERLKEYRFYHKYGTEIHLVRDLRDRLDAFRQFMNSTICALANKPLLLLEGDAGVGKSHLFADIVEKADEGTTILLLGHYFTTQESPWLQIKQMCEIDCTEEEFWGALNAKAESKQKRIVLLIDAANESKRKEFWKDYINSFTAAISKYEWLGLAISVRSTYTRLLFPEDSVSGLIRYAHEGYGQKEGEAIRVYFKGYGIDLPNVPILQAEFQNPLFLKLYCEGQTRNRDRASGVLLNQFDAIIQNYVGDVEKRLAERLHYNESLHIAEKAINAIIDCQIANETAWLDYEKAYLAIDAVCTRYHINNALLDEMISEGVFIKNPAFDGTEKINFAYERLGDYLTAKHLLSKAEKADTAFVKGGALFEYVKDIDACMLHEGLIEAWSILMPTKTGKEFFEYVPHVRSAYAIADAFLRSMIWRPMPEVMDAVRVFLRGITHWELQRLFWDVCLTVATIPNHVFNAEYLHRRLSSYTMADRDSWWMSLLKRQWQYESPAKSLIHWAWSEESKTHISDESVRLAAMTLAWFLPSTNRNLRDSATKAMICLLKERIGVLIEVLQLFEGVNDPYVYERLYAVAFGCAVRLRDKQELTKLSKYVYETIFKDKEEVYPHILLRDYAREIIEYANYTGCALGFAMEEVRPPYKSSMPKELPSNEEIDALYKLDSDSPDFKSHYYSQKDILSSMTTEYGRGTGGYGDFGRYVFQAGLNRFEVDYDGLSNYAIQLIFDKYGYDKDKHGKFDREAGESSWHSHGVHNERIGKKYQWIAFYELLARVSDNCVKHEDTYSDEIEPYDGPWNPYVRDFDPTILIRQKGEEESTHERYWWEVAHRIRMYENNSEWMTHKDDLPEPKGLISVTDNEGEEWLALECHPEWDEVKRMGEEKYDSPKKRVWYQIRSYLVKDEDYEKVLGWIKNKNFRGRWMPEKTDWYELFEREYYWSPGFAYFDNRYREDELRSGEFHLNDNETGEYIADCRVTARAYYWEEEFDQSKEESFYINIPSKMMCEKMGLHASEKEGEFVDDRGEVVCFDPSVYHDTFSALLIRKQPLMEFLARNGLRIIWTLLCEKQILGGWGASGADNPSSLDVSGVYYLDENAELQGDFRICPWVERRYARKMKGEIYDFDEDQIYKEIRELAEKYLAELEGAVNATTAPDE